MREIRTSGSVRGEGGNPLAYSTWRGPICAASACEEKGYGDFRRSAGPGKQSQSEESLKCKVLSVKPENPKVWTSNFALYTSDLVYVFGTWHVAVWILGPRTRVVLTQALAATASYLRLSLLRV